MNVEFRRKEGSRGEDFELLLQRPMVVSKTMTEDETVQRERREEGRGKKRNKGESRKKEWRGK
jgi:hypothetical protein